MKPRSLRDDLILAPWWISVILAGAIFIGLRFIVPSIEVENPFLRVVPATVSRFAGVFALPFLVLAGVSFYRRRKVRSQLENRRSVESLLELHWKEFEDLTAELFRQRGYTVVETLGGGPDGGIDLEMMQDGAKTLVQCKRWKSKKVGLPIVRELLGAMTAEQASAGILVTTSSFTADAKAFCRDHSIQLMDGDQLAGAIRELRPMSPAATAPSTLLPPSPPEPQDSPASPSADAQPSCPKCGTMMVRRVAKRGARAGSEFWGCPNFPKCRETRPLV